jgi:hypothetical protein
MRVTRGITPPQDYASAAGRALSSRLAANAHTFVLLLEAGPGSAAAWAQDRGELAPILRDAAEAKLHGVDAGRRFRRRAS